MNREEYGKEAREELRSKLETAYFMASGLKFDESTFDKKSVEFGYRMAVQNLWYLCEMPQEPIHPFSAPKAADQREEGK